MEFPCGIQKDHSPMFGSSAIYSSEVLLNTIFPTVVPWYVSSLPVSLLACSYSVCCCFASSRKPSISGDFSLDDFVNGKRCGRCWLPQFTIEYPLKILTGAREMVKYLPCVHEDLFDPRSHVSNPMWRWVVVCAWGGRDRQILGLTG